MSRRIFFIESDRFSVTAVMILKKTSQIGDPLQISDFFELLNDRLSPVYVEFFGME